MPGPAPWSWTVYGTDFDYHRNGEVQMIVQRTWRDDGGSVSDDQLISIHEFRGNGRARYMLRPWGFQSDGQDGWTTWADNASALWTVYDGDEPTADYRMIDHPTLGLVPYPETSYTLGLAQRTPAGHVKYFHTDHLGTTQAMTDGSQDVAPRIFYSAFGEVIDAGGSVDTRYRYGGAHGYESFDASPFLHLGARWYDPHSGRFLQRDPMGMRGWWDLLRRDPFGVDGWWNVYAYGRSAPTLTNDPDGEFAIWVLAVLFVAIVAEVVEAPGPDYTHEDHASHRKQNNEQNFVVARPVVLSCFALVPRAIRGGGRIIEGMRGPPIPPGTPDHVSPLPGLPPPQPY